MDQAFPFDVSGRLGALISRKRTLILDINRVLAQYPHLIFYGCGALQQSIQQSWNRHIGRTPDFSCDEDPLKWGKEFGGAPCIPPAEMLAMKADSAVFITLADGEALAQSFRRAGLPFVQTLSLFDLDTSAVLQAHSNEALLETLAALSRELPGTPPQGLVESLLYQVLDNPRDGHFLLDVCLDPAQARLQLLERFENDRFERQSLALRSGSRLDHAIPSLGAPHAHP